MKNDFNKQLRSRLEDFESPIEMLDLWNSLDGKLDVINETHKKKKRRGFIWVLFGAALVVSTIAIVCFTNKSRSADLLISDKFSQIKVQENEAEVALNSIEDNKKIKKNKFSFAEKEPKETALKFATESNIEISAKPKENQLATTLKHKNKSTQFKSTKDARDAKDVSVKMNFKEEGFIPLQFKDVSHNLELLKEDKESLINFVNPSFKIEGPLLLESLSPPIVILNSNKSLKDISSPFSFVERKWNLSLGATTGVTVVNKNLEAISSGAEDILIRRQNSEKPLEAIHYHFLAGLHHNSGWSLHSGFGITQINERFLDVEKSTETIIDENGIYAYRITNGQDSIPIIGAIENHRHIIRTRKNFNNYRLYEIPILFGYQFKRNRWSLNLLAGINLNVQLKTKGIAFDAEEKIASIDPSLYKNNIGIAYQFGINGAYRLTDNLFLHAGPKIHLYPNSFIKEESLMRQRYQLIGLNLGISYKLN